MTAWIQKILHIILLLLGVSVVTFMLTYLAGSSPAMAMFQAQGIVPTEEQLALAEEMMGLNQSLGAQYWDWLSGVLQGDLGTSFLKNELVIDLIVSHMKPTVYLTVMSLVMMLAVAIPLGVYSATHKGKLVDKIVCFSAFAGISVPSFCVGIFLFYLFAIWLDWLPVMYTSFTFDRIILPAIALAVPMASKYCRQVRTTMLEELHQDYVLGARARGVSEWNILWKYVFPNSLLPMLALLGISVGSLLGGAAVVEIIFSYPGLGNLVVQAVNARDYPLIQGLVLWIAIVYLLVNQIVDGLYRIADPRTRNWRAM
ncbi:ABC transporter permease [Bengtsoniella intestinalis]|uniref:ABC transporter permease n=1 Tax=Bengtsoniella intestinalis TaxID=3073143 RepID=UPI00391F7D2A